jgi:branched-chain amino acid transport system ATP-binding protein
MLRIRHLHVDHAGAPALRDVSLHVERGEVVTVIGANGAGKTTLLRAIAGLKDASEGSIEFQGTSLRGFKPQDVVKLGIALVPQERCLFPHMTVAENLRLGAFLERERKVVMERMEWVFGRFPILRERRKQSANTLSGGEQQMLAIGRALMAKPTLLMLDEPSLALAPIVVERIANILQELGDSGTTVLLVEQNVRMALRVADRAYLLSAGTVVVDAAAGEMLTDPRVQRVYLGEETPAAEKVASSFLQASGTEDSKAERSGSLGLANVEGQ